MGFLGGRKKTAAKAGARPAPRVQRTQRAATPESVVGAGGVSVAIIGKSIVLKGDLSGDEDLTIDGRVEGAIQLSNHELTIGENGKAQAELFDKSVVVIGHVKGDVVATERIEIRSTGVVEGNIRAPSLVIADGAVLNGNIEMGGQASAPKAESTAKKSVAQPQPGAPAPPPAG